MRTQDPAEHANPKGWGSSGNRGEATKNLPSCPGGAGADMEIPISSSGARRRSGAGSASPPPDEI